MPPATATANPTKFFIEARALEKKGASPKEWVELRERLVAHAMRQNDNFTRLGLDAALAVMRRFYQAYVKHTRSAIISPASLECAGWNMAWLCLNRLADETDKEKRPRYLKMLCFSLLVANTFAA